MEVTFLRVKMFLEEAKQIWGLKAKSLTNSIAARFHLLRPGYRVDQLRCLEVGDMVVEAFQGE